MDQLGSTQVNTHAWPKCGT